MAKNKTRTEAQEPLAQMAYTGPTLEDIASTACKMIGEESVLRRIEMDRQMDAARFASLGEQVEGSDHQEGDRLEPVEMAE